METPVNATGFLNDAKYTYHIDRILDAFEPRFGGKLERIEVTLEEVFAPANRMADYNFTDDGRSCKIILRFVQFQRKGKTIPPTPEDVTSSLHNYLDRVVVPEYTRRFLGRVEPTE